MGGHLSFECSAIEHYLGGYVKQKIKLGAFKCKGIEGNAIIGLAIERHPICRLGKLK
jgi:hypothetical protein